VEKIVRASSRGVRVRWRVPPAAVTVGKTHQPDIGSDALRPTLGVIIGENVGMADGFIDGVVAIGTRWNPIVALTDQLDEHG
jgi:hypothetical protein